MWEKIKLNFEMQGFELPTFDLKSEGGISSTTGAAGLR